MVSGQLQVQVRTRVLMVAAAALVLVGAGVALAEEIWLHDNSRIYGLVRDVDKAGTITVLQATGQEQKVPMEDVISVRFLGRNPLLVQSGTQEFRFINGGTVRGQILYNNGDLVLVQTAMAGLIEINLSHVKGFVSLPLSGFSGRKAEELIESETGRLSPSLDQLLERRGSVYPGVIRRFERTQFFFDHEELLQVFPVDVLAVAGVRLADAGRDELKPWKGDVRVRIRGRDDSVIQGSLQRIHLGRWHLVPDYDPKTKLLIDVEEISLVQVLGGRVQYLSQLTPVKAEESTVLAPPQPYRVDHSSQGDPISIAGKRYPWGIGVHANSELTYELNGRFNEFRSAIGIASRMGDRGSVVFTVLGDGKELFKSKVMTGAVDAPVEVNVPVKGVKLLTLKVDNGGDLDLGDVANWGSARVLR